MKALLERDEDFLREAGVIVSQAVLVAVGIDWDGRRQILGVELANRESRSNWKEFLVGLKARGLGGVELVVSDDHAGLTAAIREVLPEAAWQRCYVHFLRNALDHLPRKADDDCLQELRWMYDRRDLAEVRRDLVQLSIANMLSELRMYQVGAVLANQYLHQLEAPIRVPPIIAIRRISEYPSCQLATDVRTGAGQRMARRPRDHASNVLDGAPFQPPMNAA